MHKQHLSQGWTLRAAGDVSQVPSNIRDRAFPAWVPSCVHTVLMRAGAIEDPYIGDGEARTSFIGESDWEYRCTFDAAGELFDYERIDLVCDGLDTVATIRLNDREIGRGENMHVGYRFDARGALRRGTNELVITLQSPLKYARSQEARLGPLPRVNGLGGPFNFIRKMACNFGWDWGPALVTSGVWKGVRLEGWSQSRLACFGGELLSHSKGAAIIRVTATFEMNFDTINVPEAFLEDSSGLKVGREIAFEPGDSVDQNGTSTCTDTWDYELANPQFWWPRGHGGQPLYRVGMVRNSIYSRHHLGLRTIELDTPPDSIGRGFVIKVNGKPIFCKGWNWIPDDCFLDRACEPARYRRRIQQAIDCGSNMLRVWGGGIYETDAFYDICDELGVLVWQDFPFACACYPEEEPLASLVEQEARYNVARLSHHPSLVLWNGHNENFLGYRNWGWKDKVKGRTWGAGFYLQTLPKIVKELDPSRPYWAGSPWSADPDYDEGLHPNDEHHGNKHVWEVWHGPGDFVNYRRFAPRFCSEFGFQAPPTYATLARVTPPEERKRGSKSLELHQKAPGGNAINDRVLQMYFDLPENFDDYHYLLQVMQARALQCGVEWFRSRAPVCMGTLIWQLNDCWPVASWSAIDGDEREKPLWFAAKRFYADRLLTIQPGGSGQILHAINDSDEPWSSRAFVTLREFVPSGPHAPPMHTAEFTVGPRSQEQIPVPESLCKSLNPATTCLGALSQDGHRTLWFEGPDKRIRYPQPQFQHRLEHWDGQPFQLKLTANTLLRDVCIFVDRLDPEATISDQFFTLLPGDSISLSIHSKRSLTAEQILSPPVFNCVNRVVARK